MNRLDQMSMDLEESRESRVPEEGWWSAEIGHVTAWNAARRMRVICRRVCFCFLNKVHALSESSMRLH
jgi:hypothetical protein